MYKLYNVKAWGSMSVHFLLEEMAVPYTNIWMTPEQVAAPAPAAVVARVPAPERRSRPSPASPR